MIRKIILLTIGMLFSAYTGFGQSVALKPGDMLSNIVLPATNGTTYDLKAQKQAKGFIVVFMTPTCDHCIMYEKRVMALDKKYKPKGFPVVAIGPYGDDPQKYPLDAMPEMKKLAQKNGFTFPYLSDQKFKYTWLLGIQLTPTAVILEKKNQGFFIRYIGKIDDQPDPKLVPKHKHVEKIVDGML